jgi:hypothetical protein
MLRPDALARLGEGVLRFCGTPSCPTVYFGSPERFLLEEIVVPVFQKARPGDRTVCYCFAVTEQAIENELAATGGSTVVARISAFVKADRCACELKNPQGSCCLGNLRAVVRAAQVASGGPVRSSGSGALGS